MRPSPFAFVLVAVLVTGACSNGSKATSDGRLDVVASFYPLAEVAANVGGDRVHVTNLTPVGAEPHDIELTPRQVDEVHDADVVVYVGAHFQPAVAEVADRRRTGRVDVLDHVTLAKNGDPHFWLDPTLLAKVVDEVKDALSSASPDDAPTFAANARRYDDVLHALDRELADGLRSCARREIVTTHTAFSYLTRRYGLTQVGIAGLSPEAEPDADRLATLADEIKARGVTTVFYESLVSPKVAQTLAREAGVRTAVLNPIEGLTDAQRAAGANYVSLMRDNLAALRTALGCS